MEHRKVQESNVGHSGAVAWPNSRLFEGRACRERRMAWCCRSDTPPASLLKVSRSRPTTDQHRCFVAAWLMLILPKRSARWPRRISRPLHAPGPAATSTEIPGPVAEGGTGRRNKTPIPRQGGTTDGDRGRVRMSLPRRTARGRYNTRPIRHSVGRKMVLN